MAYKSPPIYDLIKAESLLLEAAKLAPNDTGIRTELKSVRDELKTINEKAKQELKRNLQNAMQ
jgi:hypothetical protein